MKTPKIKLAPPDREPGPPPPPPKRLSKSERATWVYLARLVNEAVFTAVDVPAFETMVLMYDEMQNLRAEVRRFEGRGLTYQRGRGIFLQRLTTLERGLERLFDRFRMTPKAREEKARARARVLGSGAETGRDYTPGVGEEEFCD